MRRASKDAIGIQPAPKDTTATPAAASVAADLAAEEEEHSGWFEYFDQDSGCAYYLNAHTDDVSWELPPGITARKPTDADADAAARTATPRPLSVSPIARKTVVSRVACGAAHTIVALEAVPGRPQVYTWGQSLCGQLGHGNPPRLWINDDRTPASRRGPGGLGRPGGRVRVRLVVMGISRRLFVGLGRGRGGTRALTPRC